MLRDRLAAVRGTDGRVCGKRHFLRFVAFYVMLRHVHGHVPPSEAERRPGSRD